jgi:hypothetical protein
MRFAFTLASAADAPLGPREKQELASLRKRARREASCQMCRGYGWHVKRGLPGPGDGHAGQVYTCACAAGERFWALALDATDELLALMDLDPTGRIASADGMYGRFGINDRRVLAALARVLAAGRTERRR